MYPEKNFINKKNFEKKNAFIKIRKPAGNLQGWFPGVSGEGFPDNPSLTDHDYELTVLIYICCGIKGKIYSIQRSGNC